MQSHKGPSSWDAFPAAATNAQLALYFSLSVLRGLGTRTTGDLVTPPMAAGGLAQVDTSHSGEKKPSDESFLFAGHWLLVAPFHP